MNKLITILFLIVFFSSAYSQPYFQKVTNDPVVNTPSAGFNSAWGDYDNDGNADIVISGYYEYCSTCNWPLLLFHNNGDGSFTRVTTGPIANYQGQTFGLAWGDYDNDGRLDLIVCRGNHGHNLLFHNEGSGNFSQVTTGPIVEDSLWGESAAWCDYDRDGWLDLYVPNQHWQNNSLFHNNGNGTFTKVTTGIIVNDAGWSSACSWGDYDNDGWPDLWEVQHIYGEPDNYYHNNGDGTFDRTSVTVGQWGVGCSWGDYDNDGFLDIIITGVDSLNHNAMLYHNNSNGTFSPVYDFSVTQQAGPLYGASWGDYDNDGWLDLSISRKVYDNLLFKNKFGKGFYKVTDEIPSQEQGTGGSITWADYNNDGKLDLLSTNPGNGEFDYLYKNTGATGNYLNCRLIGGCFSNKAAIGARVTIYAGGLKQIREISGGSSMGSQDLLWPHFGLGSNSMVDSLIVSWPYGATPKLQKLINISANQTITIEECLIGVNGNQIPATYNLKQNYPNPFNPSTKIEYSLARNTHVKLVIYDVMGKEVSEIVNGNENSGTHVVNFDASNLSSGVYIYKISTVEFSEVKKMLLLK